MQFFRCRNAALSQQVVTNAFRHGQHRIGVPYIAWQRIHILAVQRDDKRQTQHPGRHFSQLARRERVGMHQIDWLLGVQRLDGGQRLGK